MNDRITKNPEILKKFQQAIALGRIGEVEEIATTAIFLASAASGYITGTTILADGGFLLQWPVH